MKHTLMTYTKRLMLALALMAAWPALAQDTLQNVFLRSYGFEKNQQYADAIAAMKDVYKPNSYEINLRLGYLHYLAGAQAEAISFYEKALALHPNCIEARLGMVLPLSVLKKWDDVLLHYENIIKLAPNNTYVNYNLGLMYYNRKMYPEAARCFEIVHRLYPFDYGGLLMMGWTNLQLGRKAEATAYFSKTLLISPYDKSALEGLALLK